MQNNHFLLRVVKNTEEILCVCVCACTYYRTHTHTHPPIHHDRCAHVPPPPREQTSNDVVVISAVVYFTQYYNVAYDLQSKIFVKSHH